CPLDPGWPARARRRASSFARLGWSQPPRRKRKPGFWILQGHGVRRSLATDPYRAILDGGPAEAFPRAVLPPGVRHPASLPRRIHAAEDPDPSHVGDRNGYGLQPTRDPRLRLGQHGGAHEGENEGERDQERDAEQRGDRNRDSPVPR